MRLHSLGRYGWLVLLVARGLLGCNAASVGTAGGGGGSGGASSGGATRPIVAILPSVAYVAPGTTSAFRATVSGAVGAGLRWSVDESDGGSVDEAGNYQAPQRIGTFHVRAVLGEGTASGAALVTVTPDGGSTAACATAALRTGGSAPVYYYCACEPGVAATGCVEGSDGNTGTSPNAPRKSVADAVAHFNALPAGGTVAFCRGGAFTMSSVATLANASCTATSTCDFRDYAPAGMESAPRPVFLAGSHDAIGVLGAIHKEGHRIWNLDIRHTGGAGTTINIGDSATDIDVCNVAMSGGGIGVLEQTTNQRLTIRNNTISNYANQGILAGSSGLLIDSNVLVDCGFFTSNRSHSLYLQGGIEQAPDGYHDERVVNNDIVGTSAGTCVGPVFVASGRNHDMLIENNRITIASAGGGCYGIMAGNGGYPYGTWHDRAIVRRNRVQIPGAYNGIGVSVCTDCQITDNLVVLDTDYDAQLPIAVPESYYRPDQGDARTERALVQNNTVYQPRSRSVLATYPGVRVGEGSGHVVENNVVFTSGSAATCFGLSGTDRAANNYCRSSGGAAVSAIFRDVAAGDFRPADGSPIIAFGSATSYSSIAPAPAWSAKDPGVARTPPIDAGAFVH